MKISDKSSYQELMSGSSASKIMSKNLLNVNILVGGWVWRCSQVKAVNIVLFCILSRPFEFVISLGIIISNYRGLLSKVGTLAR